MKSILRRPKRLFRLFRKPSAADSAQQPQSRSDGWPRPVEIRLLRGVLTHHRKVCEICGSNTTQIAATVTGPAGASFSFIMPVAPTVRFSSIRGSPLAVQSEGMAVTGVSRDQ